MKLTPEQRAALRAERRAMSDEWQRMPLWLVALWMVLLILVGGIAAQVGWKWVVSLRF